MQQVAGGAFSMGSTNNSPAYFQETPVHEVTLSSFSMAKHEVTQKEWYAVMGTTAADLLALRNMLYPPTEQNSYKVEVLYGEGENHPIYYVTWYEAVEYCNRLSAHEGLPPAYTINKNTDPWTVTCDFAAGYRLPTEAEWEYAARGGDSGDNFKYSGSDTLDDVAWYSGTSGGNTHPVGWKKPNGLGLYDMTGNANEWCWDWAQPNYYSISLSDNPTGPVDNSVSGDYRVTRGGDFIDGATLSTLSNLRTADRGGIAPYARLRSLGFRVVRPQP
jgi:formylglycine-generating enzyme required for sulfatase activity